MFDRRRDPLCGGGARREMRRDRDDLADQSLLLRDRISAEEARLIDRALVERPVEELEELPVRTVVRVEALALRRREEKLPVLVWSAARGGAERCSKRLSLALEALVVVEEIVRAEQEVAQELLLTKRRDQPDAMRLHVVIDGPRADRAALCERIFTFALLRFRTRDEDEHDDRKYHDPEDDEPPHAA